MGRLVVLVLAALLLLGCGLTPGYRILEMTGDTARAEVSVYTRSQSAAGVERVIDAAIARARRRLHAEQVTVYVVDTTIYIGVVYDVAVAYWGADGRRTVYLREKITHPGTLQRPTDAELSYFGIEHRLHVGRPDLLTAAEKNFYQRYGATHSADELSATSLRVMRWLNQ